MINIDRFPEAFERFKHSVNVDRIETFQQLVLSFSGWAGQKWKGTDGQYDALQREWDEETGFSRRYTSFQQWQTQTLRSTAYQRRISNYMWNHPDATLAEARGHTKRHTKR